MRALDAEAKLAEAEKKRAELERSFVNMAVCLTPRVLFPVNSAALKRYARKVSIEYIPNDAEARRAATSLKTALHAMGWTVINFSTKEGIKDGVEVQPFVGHFDEWEAADSVVDFLQSFNWQSQTGFLLDDNGVLIRNPDVFPPDALRIRVGLYPAAMYVIPPGAEPYVEAYNAFQGQINKDRAEIDAKGKKAEAEDEANFLSHLTPEAAARYKERKSQEEAKERRDEQRRIGPCQPLASIPFFKF